MFALEYLRADEDGKARMLSILRFDFIITLVTIEYVLQRLLPLTFLQAKQCDLVEAAKKAVTVISHLQDRTEVWNVGGGLHYMKALWNWQRNSKFNRASRAGKQSHCENVPADTPFQYWKRAMYLPTRDHVNCCKKCGIPRTLYNDIWAYVAHEWQINCT